MTLWDCIRTERDPIIIGWLIFGLVIAPLVVGWCVNKIQGERS